MNKLNTILAVFILFLAGVVSGMYVAKYDYGRINSAEFNAREMIAVVESSRVQIQIEFLNFYINKYCTNNHRMIDINMSGLIWTGMYCDKDTVMVLSDSFPPLPIAVINVNLEENDPK